MPLDPIAPNVTYLAQAAGALFTALVFHAFYRAYGRGYLLEWTRSWLALCAYLLYSGVGGSAAGIWPATHPLPPALAGIASLAGWCQVAWLLLGTYELTTSQPVARPARRALFAVLVPVAIATGILFAGDGDTPERHDFLNVGVRSLAAGVAFCYAAVAVWRRYGRRPGVGYRILATSFAAYGALLGYRFACAAAGLVRGAPVEVVYYLGAAEFIVQFALSVGLVIALLESERQIAVDAADAVEQLAYHDALTGLPNRRLFLDRLLVAIATAHRGGHRLAVFFVDLDRFKTINDSLGHAAGDELLRTVAARMRRLLRENDTVARLGGDEFTVLSPNVTHGEDAITVAHKVREAIGAPIVIDGRELFVTASLGISLYPDDGETADALLRNADSALYRAKARGRDTFELYRPAMNAKALEQLTLESSMRRAVTNGEFVLHYQPIVHLASGMISGTEALLRWDHPDRGLLAPDSFIFLAEVTGLIVPLGEWVLHTACAQTRTWQLAGHPALRASVNLSVRQLQQPDFVERVERVLHDTGLAADCLELEVTESIAMHNAHTTYNGHHAEHAAEGTTERLRALNRLGVRIVIDDFGTGYSSLSALRLLPVDTLKIDRSFVADVGDGGDAPSDNAAIAAAVIALAHSLNLTVVAEGVETAAQLRFLAGHGCDAWQGYLGGRPARAAVWGEALARGIMPDGRAEAADASKA